MLWYANSLNEEITSEQPLKEDQLYKKLNKIMNSPEQ